MEKSSNYPANVATVTLSSFLKLLLIWKASIWKLVKTELFLWLLLYGIIQFLYLSPWLDASFAENLSDLIKYINDFLTYWRLSVIFVLGFYLLKATTRRREIAKDIPSFDTIATNISAFLHDTVGLESEMIQRNYSIRCRAIKYLAVSYILIFHKISVKVQRKFPNLDKLVPTLISKEELAQIVQDEPDLRYLKPIQWIILWLKDKSERNEISEEGYILLTQKTFDYYEKLKQIQNFEFPNVPLIYTQLVNMTVWIYFILALIGKQPTGLPFEMNFHYRLAYSVPYLMIVEILFYFGWLRIAQVMMNPFESEDDEIDMAQLLDRNLNVALTTVTDLINTHPDIVFIENNIFSQQTLSLEQINKATLEV